MYCAFSQLATVALVSVAHKDRSSVLCWYTTLQYCACTNSRYFLLCADINSTIIPANLSVEATKVTSANEGQMLKEEYAFTYQQLEYQILHGSTLILDNEIFKTLSSLV